MAVKITNSKQFENKSELEIYELFVEKAPQLQILAQRQVERAYSTLFTRNPLDTGKAKANTVAIVEAQKRPTPILSIIFKIMDNGMIKKGVNYAIYFLEPLQPKNPNYKYGKRNTVLGARDLLAKRLKIKTSS